MERIFHRGWVFVGHESEIPGPGDFVTRTLGTQPVLMVRGSEGGVSVFLNGYASFDKSAHGLPRVPRLSSYRGFVFASLCPRGPSLGEHLGAATRLIDRSCDLSPEGEIELSAGWVKHQCAANWKMLPENDSDGYHLGFVHLALFKTIRTQYRRVVGDEKTIRAVVRDWGHGHIPPPGWTSRHRPPDGTG